MARMNDAGGTFVNAHVANTGTVKVGPKGNKETRTKRHIAAGEEICIQYGRVYWSKWGPRKEPVKATRGRRSSRRRQGRSARDVRGRRREAELGEDGRRAAASAVQARGRPADHQSIVMR